MDTYHYILLGLKVGLLPVNLLMCFVGVLIGTLVGVLPGLGPVAAMALLLPITFHLTPVTAIIMLSGIYYGAMYGGSTTSILVNIPGEAASVVTCLDGYRMARKGRAGPALGMAAFGSFIAGTMGILILMLVANPMSAVVLRFGPPQYFSLMVLGMTLLIYLAQESKIKALVMVCFGLILGFIGIDVLTGQPRFNYGWMELADGVGVVPLIMGVFGIAEVLVNIEDMTAQDVYETRIKGLFPTRRDWADSKWPIARGTAIGFFLGLLPGGGPIIASFSSYAIEKRLSKHPEKFGTGIIEGVAGPESANNAATASGYVPLFLIGIPTNGVMAMLFSALLIHGLQPGPLILKDHPEIFWGTVMSMYLGNVMLLVLNLPLIGLWIKILKIPYQILFPLILSFCIIGAYSINNSVIDVVAMLVFGVVGYLMRKFRYEGAPLILAFVLGPLLERAFVQSLNMSAGSYSIFFNEPISAVTLTIAFVLVLLSALSVFRKMAAEG
ncbi:MAG TPA: transporter [Syntrophus sp. (in: bacteria)]|nr:transporter [Syntrophus sp. (in: bacteria)]